MPDTQGAASLGAPRPVQQEIKVPPLPVHPPEQVNWLTPELKARAAEISALTDQNWKEFQRLRSMGVTIPAAKVLELKFEALLNRMFDTSTKRGQFHRLEFEAEFERLMRKQITESIADAEAAMADVKSQLRQQFMSGRIPAGFTDEQIISLAAELGMPVPEALLKKEKAAGGS